MFNLYIIWNNIFLNNICLWKYFNCQCFISDYFKFFPILIINNPPFQITFNLNITQNDYILYNIYCSFEYKQFTIYNNSLHIQYFQVIFNLNITPNDYILNNICSWKSFFFYHLSQIISNFLHSYNLHKQCATLSILNKRSVWFDKHDNAFSNSL